MTQMILKLFIAVLILGSVSEISLGKQTDSLAVEEPDSTGFLKIIMMDLDTFDVVINNRFDDVKEIASGDSIELAAGRTHFRIVKQYYIDVQRYITIEEGETHRIQTNMIQIRGNELMNRRSSYPRLFWEGNNFVLTDSDTELYINGEYKGTHYAIVDTTREFEVRGVHSSGREFRTNFIPEKDRVFNFHERFVKPSRSKARGLSFIPGGSQFYKKQPLKAIAFSVVMLGGAALAYSYETRYQDSMDTFNRLNYKYKAANNPQEAYVLGNEAEEAFNESAGFASTRNRIIYGTALIYIANIVDGFIAPSIGYREESRRIDPYLDFDPAYRQPVVGIKSSF